MSVKQQLSNSSFLNLIAAIRKIDITELLNEVTDDTPQQPKSPILFYKNKLLSSLY